MQTPLDHKLFEVIRKRQEIEGVKYAIKDRGKHVLETESVYKAGQQAQKHVE
jgi:hypothetical protein